MRESGTVANELINLATNERMVGERVHAKEQQPAAGGFLEKQRVAALRGERIYIYETREEGCVPRVYIQLLTSAQIRLSLTSVSLPYSLSHSHTLSLSLSFSLSLSLSRRTSLPTSFRTFPAPLPYPPGH